MRMRDVFRLLFVFVFSMSVSCAQKGSSADLTDTIPEPTTVPAESSAGGSEEEEKMKREFCVVESLQEDYFVLKNAYDELYHIDLSFLDEYKEGDKVLLLYRERELISEGVYAADTYAVYTDDDTLLQPAK